MALLTDASTALAGLPVFRELALEVERERSGLLWGRLDADARLDLLVGSDADLSVYFQEADGSLGEAVAFRLDSQLRGGLFDLADLDGDGVQELIVLHRSGVDRYSFDRQSEALMSAGPPLLNGLRGISFLHLTHEDFLYDMDGDGDEDLAFPLDGRYLIYQQQESVFRRVGQVKTEGVNVVASVGRSDLSGEIQTRILVPRLWLEDVDGDGRLDLRRKDGSHVPLASSGLVSGEFSVTALSEDPLEDFKRRHDIPLEGPGVQISSNGSETFQAQLGDVDDDGVDDYTIVYRNRIWVYKGTPEGFDFERSPDQLLKVSAVDRIAIFLLPLNDDTRPDLIIFKFEVPSVARLIAALAIGLRAEVDVLAYYNDGDPVFSRKPNHRSTFVVKLPPLLRLLGQLEELAEQFEEILRPIQGVSSGDYNGDGRKDVLRVSGDQLEIYLSAEGDEPIDLGAGEGLESFRAYGGSELLREALFERDRTDLTLESTMRLLRELVSGLQTSIVADREPSGTLPIGRDSQRVDQIISTDLNSDGIADIVVFLEPEKPEEGQDLDDERQTLRLWISERAGQGQTSGQERRRSGMREVQLFPGRVAVPVTARGPGG